MFFRLATLLHRVLFGGAGEVDVKEFGKWYKSLSERPPGSGGMSKLELLKLKSILAESAVPHLCARQPPPASPADAMVGGASFGAFLEAFGCDATPSPARMDPSGALALSRYNAGSFSIAAHGGKDGAAASDALQLTVPSRYAAPSRGRGRSVNPCLNSEACRLQLLGNCARDCGGSWDRGQRASAGAMGGPHRHRARLLRTHCATLMPAVPRPRRLKSPVSSQVSAHYNWQTTPGDGISETAVKTDFSKGGRRASVYG